MGPADLLAGRARKGRPVQHSGRMIPVLRNEASGRGRRTGRGKKRLDAEGVQFAVRTFRASGNPRHPRGTRLPPVLSLHCPLESVHTARKISSSARAGLRATGGLGAQERRSPPEFRFRRREPRRSLGAPCSRGTRPARQRGTGRLVGSSVRNHRRRSEDLETLQTLTLKVWPDSRRRERNLHDRAETAEHRLPAAPTTRFDTSAELQT